MDRFQVLVGNIGQVYAGDDWREATRIYGEYKRQSENEFGRAAGEDVTLMRDGAPHWEHIGSASERD